MATKILKDNITINPKILDELLEFQRSLPGRATGSNKEGGMENHDDPAGIALLCSKDNKIDTVIPLVMSGGCWDAPNISHNDMYKGMIKAIEQDRVISGMALVRNPNWHSGGQSFNAKIPIHLVSEIINLQNSFEDITKTLWLILHDNGYFRIYIPSLDSEGRVKVKENKITNFFSKEDIKDSSIGDRIKKERIDKEKARKARLQREAEEKKIREQEEENIKKREDLRKKGIEDRDKKFKEAKEDTIDIGSGYIMLKTKDGKYILWNTGNGR